MLKRFFFIIYQLPALALFANEMQSENLFPILKIEEEKNHRNLNLLIFNEEKNISIFGICKDRDGWYVLKEPKAHEKLATFVPILEDLFSKNDSSMVKVDEKIYLNENKLILGLKEIFLRTDENLPIVGVSKDSCGWSCSDNSRTSLGRNNLKTQHNYNYGLEKYFTLGNFDVGITAKHKEKYGKSTERVGGTVAYSHNFDNGSRIDMNATGKVKIDSNKKVSKSAEARVSFTFQD